MCPNLRSPSSSARSLRSLSRLSLRLAPICSLMLGCVAASTPPRAPSRVAASDDFPSLATPEIKATLAPKPRLDLLPPELQSGRLAVSNLSLQRVSLELRPSSAAAQSPREVFERVVAPLLRALSFARGTDAFRIPSKAVPEPTANLHGAAALLVDQYLNVQERMRPATGTIVTAALGEPSESADSRLRFLTGRSVEQFRAEFEREQLTYLFAQVLGDVPIEHTALTARRRSGETVSQLTGTLIHHYEATNERPAPDADPRPFLRRALERLAPGREVRMGRAAPVLVALPYGNAPSGAVGLKYAWRAQLEMQVARHPASFLAWVDAQSGKLLKLEPLTARAEARGITWRRDPSTPAVPRKFAIDPATAGLYQLSLSSVSNRVDYGGDGETGDVSIADGSGSPPANFDQSPHNSAAGADCGGNPSFPQITFFAWLQSSHQQALHNGIYPPFPESPWKPKIEQNLCLATSNLFFGACPGYFAPACPEHPEHPEHSDDPDPEQTYLSFAQDGTIVAHEVGHLAVKRLTLERPDTWCGDSSCQKPIGWDALHDLADAWAAHLQDTNCVGGWVAKNVNGTDESKNCIGPDPTDPREGRHSEDSLLPRRHELDLVFQPSTPHDHFPERAQAQQHGEYASMQIGAAVLWQLREGMASRLPVLGGLVYFQRLLAALRATGMTTQAPPATDAGLYSYFYELQSELLSRWAPAGSGEATTNEVLAAFARAGLFALPPECLDHRLDTFVTTFCPDGESGADAVIDVDDNDGGDDALIDAVRHQESDFLALDGPAPTFHVWTGARYTFDAAGRAILGASAPCNTHFQVDASTDPGFAPEQTLSSTWLPITDGGEAGTTCQGAWTPDAVGWTTLRASGDGSKIYYRARTGNASGGNLRSSLSPGNGMWSVEPPFAVLAAAGVPDI